jgi:transcriptional regulator with XRE-family HTH domain
VTAREVVVAEQIYPGARIARARLRRGWTQRQLAERLGVTDGMVCRIEAGQNRVSPSVALNAETALGLSARKLLHLQADADLAEATVSDGGRPRP